MPSRIERVLSFMLSLAALVVAVAVVRLAFFQVTGSARGSIENPAAAPTAFFPDWRSMLEAGIRIGDMGADIQIIEFTDLQCQFCARFHRDVFVEVWPELKDRLGFAIMHLPLQRHPFAESAAHALECAHEQQRTEAFLDVVYARQHAIGTVAWWEFARHAEVPDSSRFEECLGDAPPPRIAAGPDWAERVGVRGTPTVLVNGWRLANPIHAAELLRVVEAIQAGEPPYPGPQEGP